MDVNDLEKSFKKLCIKGSECSVSGNAYEKLVYNIVKKCNIDGKAFNTQSETDLGGSRRFNDIECNFKGQKDTCIEIKKYNTPDWMQCSLKFDKLSKKWTASKSSHCKELFDGIIGKLNIFNGELPPFVERKMTYDEWTQIKKETCLWNDIYFDIPPDTIRKLYQHKGCNYIQISDGYGLYHLGTDLCNFGVPIFEIQQHLRIRIRVHSKKTKDGNCSLSVMASCKSKKIKNLSFSKFSLDNIEKLPAQLIYY